MQSFLFWKKVSPTSSTIYVPQFVCRKKWKTAKIYFPIFLLVHHHHHSPSECEGGRKNTSFAIDDIYNFPPFFRFQTVHRGKFLKDEILLKLVLLLLRFKKTCIKEIDMISFLIGWGKLLESDAGKLECFLWLLEQMLKSLKHFHCKMMCIAWNYDLKGFWIYFDSAIL